MKKIALILFASVLSTGLFAQKISITSGDLNFLKNEKTINVEFTYNKTKVGKMTEVDYKKKKISEYNTKTPGSGETWATAWEADKPNRYQPKFMELFNKAIEGKVTLTEGSGAKYKMVVNADMLEPGWNIGVSRRSASVNLTCSFVEVATGKTVGVVTIINSSAADFMGTDFDVAYRIQESFAKAGRELARFLVKKVKI
jgi:hypothetical protein